MENNQDKGIYYHTFGVKTTKIKKWGYNIIILVGNLKTIKNVFF